MEKSKLISMTAFVLQTYEKNDDYKVIANECLLYANFLSQPLTLGMFVPCDDDGNVLEEPQKENFTEENGFVNNAFFIETNVFQEAKSKVLFNDFDIKQFDRKTLKEINLIEDLIPYNLDLTVSF